MILNSTGAVLFEGEECGSAWLQCRMNEALTFSNPSNWVVSEIIQDDSYHFGETIRKQLWVCNGTATNQSPEHEQKPWLTWQERLEEYKGMVGMNPYDLTLKIFGYIPKTRKF